ncbi:Nitrogen permease regulator 2 [Venustampulla echinocandica]|uniref:Nitrogen permease regulator 2 n=1 Tax=Venustampulla echinocandica TaxID=2656787 RepID=A0A370TEH0_9HELO|nr:Nitrogen permease regulator 2 [Venustampulla echinocandica]RDL33089.1 Nitrogen permease regulator 2 [Venustampulla echinocandica]
MIQGMFFARFLPQKGTKVVHQSPPGCIVHEPGVDKPRFFDFETMAEYIIPRQAFCNRYVTICDPDNKYRILGHPVCIKDEKYERNEFMFNFGIVIDVEADKMPYEAVVRRLASTFTEMEIQNQFLSQEHVSTKDSRSISALLEIIKEDLNNYNECMIPVDDANTINMKLFPIYKHPPPVKSWHVPISKMKFSEIMDDTWDLTMKKVILHIDGIKDVRRIAHDADVALDLTKIALQHLLYYDSILMLDMFMFGNIYAPTPSINDFLSDKDGMQDECANYVYINGPRLSNQYLCSLFATLCSSRTLKEWLKLHLDQGFPVLNYVDVRRFIQFGVIKGLLYRVHKYTVSSQYIKSIVSGRSVDIQGGGALQKYADGCHCFDQIMVEQNMSDQKIMEHLRKFPKGDVEIIYR